MSVATQDKELHEFLVDVATTFAEHPYSWFDARYDWYQPGLDGGRAVPGPNGWSNITGKVRASNFEEGEKPGPWKTLGPDLVAKGFALLATGPVGGLHESGRAHLLGEYGVRDAGNIDINDADVVLQCAVFGEVVYG